MKNEKEVSFNFRLFKYKKPSPVLVIAAMLMANASNTLYPKIDNIKTDDVVMQIPNDNKAQKLFNSF